MFLRNSAEDSAMRRTGILLAVVLLVVVGGCAGISGGGSNGTNGAASSTDGDAPGGEATSLDGPHPHTEDDALVVDSLVTGHAETLRSMETFVLTDTVTVTHVSNGSLLTEVTTEKRFDLGAERFRIERRQTDATGAESQLEALYQNATTRCTRRSGSAECGESPFDPDRALGRVVEITSLETVAAPAFSPNGTTTLDGDAVYRFSASSMRADPPEDAVTELGRNPTVESATLLVSPDGHVVRYDVRFTVDSDSGRVRLERSYRISPTESGSVSPPEWVGS